ncbi:hypothetical protein JWG45_20155 [Leptospira sp. 201903070]|uniref:DUF996 domain-containing protein n=1 Tax=Leptospira ainlahdjerensis TaxID=2810033 RepID=A0ABS2UGF3_9LEPT|nr:hypothetical protein [Leptospira ainlahdjerensis]MBM9579461.1 hypothetical protein [Leptospira ainlahdjerensis]
MKSFLKRKLGVIVRVGNLSIVPTFVSLGFLLAFLFVPFLKEISDRNPNLFVGIVSVFLLTAGAFFATKFGLYVIITGKAKQSLIPGILESDIPEFFARILGVFYFILGAFAFLIGIVLLLVSVF